MQPKGYSVTIWADNFRQWHARADFYPALGNTGEAERVADNALKTMKRKLKQTIRECDNSAPDYRHKWQISANTVTPGIGTLRSLTITERKENEIY